MSIKKGLTVNPIEHEAVAEFYDQVAQDNICITIFFCSPKYDLDALTKELNNKFKDTKLIGCTTAGEISTKGLIDQGISGFSLAKNEFCAIPYLIENVSNLKPENISNMSKKIHKEIETMKVEPKKEQLFSLLLIDGLSTSEETVVSLIHDEYRDIPLFGGSAGDGLEFGETFVFCNGKFVSNAAVFTLFKTTRKFEVIRTQHFTPTDTKMVVTEAEPSKRIVTEINGLPAAEEYRNLIGIDGELTPEIFSENPVVVTINGQNWVRSIQKENPDGSLTFYCAIDEGIVLTLSKGDNLIENLKNSLQETEKNIGEIDLIITCDCILRRLEIDQKKYREDIKKIADKYQTIGFSTYGEQFNSMHVNQTFTGVAISKGEK